VAGEALSRQPLAFSPRNCLVLFQQASFPARLQKAKEVRSQHHHRLKFDRIERL
jgi:phosphoribosyl-dephospho-CoA transferase